MKVQSNRKSQAVWFQSVTQLDFYTFFRKLLKQISFLYFLDRGCDPDRSILFTCLSAALEFLNTFRPELCFFFFIHSDIEYLLSFKEIVSE